MKIKMFLKYQAKDYYIVIRFVINYRMLLKNPKLDYQRIFSLFSFNKYWEFIFYVISLVFAGNI